MSYWLWGMSAAISGVLILYLACRKYRKSVEKDVSQKIALEAANQALKDAEKRREKEAKIEIKYDKIEKALPSDWPDNGIIELSEENRRLTHQATSANLPPVSPSRIKRVVRRAIKKTKPRGVR